MKNFSFLNSSGSGSIDASNVTVGSNYDFLVKVPGYLAKTQSNTSLTSNLTLSLSGLKAGDLDNNNQINIYDFSILMTNWRQIGQ